MRISVDDGCASDWRLARLAKKYNIEAIFYWPVEWRSLAYSKGYEPLSFLEAEQIANDFEIGSHTITHRHLTALPWEHAHDEVVESQQILERLFGKPVTKFCPPRGYTNDDLTDLALEIYDTQRLTRGPGLVHVHPDSGANGNRPWRERAEAGCDELWCHSWELDRFGLWDELEGFIREHRR